MTVDIVFDEDLDTTRSAPAASAFMVTVGTADPVAVAPASVAFHSTDADTFTLTMSTATAGRPQVSVDYIEAGVECAGRRSPATWATTASPNRGSTRPPRPTRRR